MEDKIKESATKNRRGRPAKYKEILYSIHPDKEKRVAQNLYYVGITIHKLGEGRKDSFFVTPKGNFRRQGIAEQLGRIYAAGLASKEDCRELMETCKKEYDAGKPVKDIERDLRNFRLMLTKSAGAADPGQQKQ